MTWRTLLLLCALQVLADDTVRADELEDRTLLESSQIPANAMSLDELDLDWMTSQYNVARAKLSHNNRPLALAGTTYPRGVGTHALSRFVVDLKGNATRFLSLVGIDDTAGREGSAEFVVSVDGREVARSGAVRWSEAPKMLDVDLRGARYLTLEARNGSGSAHADWAGTLIFLKPDLPLNARPESVNDKISIGAPDFPTFFPAPATPRINGPRVVGCSPNRPFLFLIPATGQAPLQFSATNLPAGLKLDPKTGIINGRIAGAGEFNATLSVSNLKGRITRELKIVCGQNKLAQTPPLGWNAWNVFGETVTAELVREQADWLVKSGLAARGFSYIVIDDTWQGRRDQNGEIAPNVRFGDMKALADYLHARGLKLGLYSSPNPETCAGFSGSEGFETQDAKTYARWGVDYLKYDWCLAGSSRNNTQAETLKTAYAKMRNALDSVDRDIVLAITPYGIGDAWNWAGQIGVNSWGTGTSLLDRWDHIRDTGFALADRAEFARPGAWNDGGWLMTGQFNSVTPRFSRLTPPEQMTQFSLWSMAAAPLIVSCDLRQLDPNSFYPFATALLTNSELLDIDQDPLGQAARRVKGDGDSEIWSRPLHDGTRAVGLFNKSNVPRWVEIGFSELGLSGAQSVRDVWQQKDLGQLESFGTQIPAHGVALLRIGRATK